MGRMLTKAPAKTKGPAGPLFSYATATALYARALRKW